MMKFLAIVALLLCFPLLAQDDAKPVEKSAQKKTLAEQEPPPKPKPLKTVPTSGDIDNAIRRGIAFLLNTQNKDGSWGSATNTKELNIYAPTVASHLAYRSGVTGLVVCALIESKTTQGEQLKALEKGEEWLLKNLPNVRRDTPDVMYNVWAHAYGIKALVRMHGRLPEDKERQTKIITQINKQVELLGRYESVDGGWGYYDFRAGTQKPSSDSTSFCTATALVALKEAKVLGATVPEKLITRAVKSIERQKKPDFSYLYGEYLKYSPLSGINRPAGSLGRSQACNLCLRLWDDKTITDDVMKTWLDRLFARNLWLDIGRKRPVPHEAYFQIAGYFYYYGHYYAALCIDQLKPEERGQYQDYLAHTLLPLQEKDGSWWDYPLYNYHQGYGTAYVVMSLLRCQKK